LTWTQPPPLPSGEVRSFLEKAPIARISSLNADGTIHSAPVWFIYRDDTLIIWTTEASRKVKNIKRNRRVTVLVDDEKTAIGVLVYGEAELDYNVGLEETISVSEKYMSSRQAEIYAKEFLEIARGGAVKIIIRPRRVVTFDSGRDDKMRIPP
jgi:general stress protein 26